MVATTMTCGAAAAASLSIYRHFEDINVVIVSRVGSNGSNRFDLYDKSENASLISFNDLRLIVYGFSCGSAWISCLSSRKKDKSN